MTIKRALIWAAVSTRPQADDLKFSIPKQIEDGEAMCRANEWMIVDTLVVPGHSRDYRTLEQLAADARNSKLKIDAFDKLIKHFRDKDFDLFICRDANRFARKASLLHYIAEMIVEECGALIYSQADNLFVDEEKLPMWATIQGYRVRADVKALMDGRHNGMFAIAQQGLPTSSTILRSHVVVRDEFGTALRMEVNQDMRRLWDDVYQLIVEQHVTWGKLEAELYKLGHVGKDGQPLREHAIHGVIASPTFWGNSARFAGKMGLIRRHNWGWVYDLSQLVPEGVVLYRNTHEAVYTGEQAQYFISELERRRYASKGRSRPYRSNRYAGLIVCRDCGYRMTYTGTGNEIYMACGTRFARKKPCSNTKSLKLSTVENYLRDIQRRLQQGEDLSSILQIQDNRAQVERRRAQLNTELTSVIEQSKRAARLQLTAPENQEDIYAAEIKTLGERRESFADQLEQLDWEITHDLSLQEREAKDFADFGEKLWQLDDTEINSRLHRLFGHRRMSCYLAQIVGFEDAPR